MINDYENNKSIKIKHKNYIFLYKKSSLIYVPDFKIVKNIVIETNQNIHECFEEFRVSFKLNGTEYRGFLTQSNRLKLEANKIDCKKNIKVYIPSNGKYEILQKNDNISLIKRPRT